VVTPVPQNVPPASTGNGNGNGNGNGRPSSGPQQGVSPPVRGNAPTSGGPPNNPGSTGNGAGKGKKP
jgi:hypothetical protein